ncbi:BaiN/RdsA family NAD(P)/FAD-dependent oxidoreductase [Curvivirga aplysinae]|uniref:NAD(P)/FAD-dependent oxidoreductase n=1 Tax=Curvivirga aplysinae TaxID=2529852 RepID=UPI0012BC1260|nr:NAD(P)/FAD-dependent oxidoreductase [Curvivirga aplysinae]MTI09825.1 NAD(P)/FAD-dependent oxidoreductase [Curvivirga aplysinae]
MQIFDVIIIGGGAAGLFCAIHAGQRGRKVLVVDHSKKMAEKIRISGGGRCNFTNIHASPNDFLSNNPRFCVSALKRYTQHDFIDLVKRHGIKFHEKTLGQLFCDDSAKDIINMLLKECKDVGVTLRTETSINQITKTNNGFALESTMGPMECESLVVACGGKSIPKIGATGFGYEVAAQFGHTILETRAGLVPLTFTDQLLDHMKSLSGLSVDAIVKYGKTTFREGMLFTHRGISGPSILQISSYWKEGDPIAINMAPDHNIQEELATARDKHPKQKLSTVLANFIPKRIAEKITSDVGADRTMAELGKKTVNQAAAMINNWQVKPSGTEGYRTAEVTLGGVDTKEISSKTFESNKTEGLYFIGEVMDVTGHLGGFNFQWAWSSGYCAGQYV